MEPSQLTGLPTAPEPTRIWFRVPYLQSSSVLKRNATDVAAIRFGRYYKALKTASPLILYLISLNTIVSAKASPNCRTIFTLQIFAVFHRDLQKNLS